MGIRGLARAGALVLAGALLPACSTALVPGQPMIPETVMVEATDYAFYPPVIRLRQGQTVKLILQNKGLVEHDLEAVGLSTGPNAGTAEDAHDDGEADHNEMKAETGHAEQETGMKEMAEAGHTESEDTHDEAEEEAAGHDEAAGEDAGYDESAEAGEGEHAHDAGGVALHTQPGETKPLTFTPSAPGVYEVRCTLPGHADWGMVGLIRVEPAPVALAPAAPEG